MVKKTNMIAATNIQCIPTTLLVILDLCKDSSTIIAQL